MLTAHLPTPNLFARPLLQPIYLLRSSVKSITTSRCQYSSSSALRSHDGKDSEREQARRSFRKFALPASFCAAAAITYFVSKHYAGSTSIFDAPRFTPFTIIAREEVSPTCVILTVQPNTSSPPIDPYAELWEEGIWSVEAKQPLLQIARSYTPLPPDQTTDPGNLRFLIRKEHKGEMSAYLHALRPGMEVALRGPHTELILPETVTDVLFLAAGTSIAPALQVAYTLLEARPAVKKPKIRIIWCRRPEDCGSGRSTSGPRTSPSGMLAQEIQQLVSKHPENFEITYIDTGKAATKLNKSLLSQLTRLDSQVKSSPVHTRIDSRLLFVSGPEGFIDHYAGPKGTEWRDGKQAQGPVGGVIGSMKLRDWKVYKL